MASSGERLSAMVAEHSKWLTAFLRGLTRSEADAEDAFQDVWARLLSGAVPGEIRSERAFLARVARSVVIDRYRKGARLAVTADEPMENGETLAEGVVDESPSPRERVERQSLHEEVLAAVRCLRQGPREVALMRIEAELTFQEISEALGVPLGTVLFWMKTATDELKTKLKGRYERRS